MVSKPDTDENIQTTRTKSQGRSVPQLLGGPLSPLVLTSQSCLAVRFLEKGLRAVYTSPEATLVSKL